MLIDASSCCRRAACQMDPLPSIFFDFTNPQQSPCRKQKLPSGANRVSVSLSFVHVDRNWVSALSCESPGLSQPKTWP